MAKNQHTFAKRQREIAKKRKAEEKRLKRQKAPPSGDDSEQLPSGAEPEKPSGAAPGAEPAADTRPSSDH